METEEEINHTDDAGEETNDQIIDSSNLTISSNNDIEELEETEEPVKEEPI